VKSLPQLTWLRKGSPVPACTQTAQLNADPGNVQRGQRLESDIDVLDWLGGVTAIVTEEVVGLGRYGKTLTVLSSERIGQEPADDGDENDDDFEERWTPRFR
jgi:hypothetical protein